jgi:hypothetical protein
MNELARIKIDEEFERIITSLECGKLYGIPIDFFDLKMLVVAAYYAGWMLKSKDLSEYYCEPEK